MDDSTGPAASPDDVAGPQGTKRASANLVEPAGPARWGPFLGVTAIVLLATLAFMFVAGRLLDPLQVSSWIASVRNHWWTPLAFAACYLASALLLFPVTLLSVAAALLWGWKLGGSIELIAATLSALVPFAIGRGFAPAWLRRRLAARFPEGVPGGEGITLLLLLRLVPVIPYVALNYLAGFGRFRFRDFLITTFVGMIPSVFIFSYFVDAVAAGVVTQQQVLVRSLVAGLLLAALLLVVRVLTPSVRARMGR